MYVSPATRDMRPTDQASERVLTKRERGGGYMCMSQATRDMCCSIPTLTSINFGFYIKSIFLNTKHTKLRH